MAGGSHGDSGTLAGSATAGIEPVGYPLERVHYVKGKVEHTIPGTAPERIALLRLDADRYESTKHELRHLYPRLSRGGVLTIDDYGAWLGIGSQSERLNCLPEECSCAQSCRPSLLLRSSCSRLLPRKRGLLLRTFPEM
jgi:hypothetical protein